jgi:two-component system, NarL family, nitrate/nitrite sensor histidine kinase NarX
MRRWLDPHLKRVLLPASMMLLAAVGVYTLARSAGGAVGWSIALSIATLLALGGWWSALTWRGRWKAVGSAQHDQQAAMKAAEEQLREAQQREAESRRRMDLLFSFNRSLVEARDEKSLMDASLAAINALVGAIGSSFVPIDEWEQPLPAFTFGQLPEPVLRAWAGHLVTSMLRERCASCSVLHSSPGGCPLHPQSIGDTLSVFCVPLYARDPLPAGVLLHNNAPLNASGQLYVNVEIQASSADFAGDNRPLAARGLRKLGMLNLYLPAGRVLDDETSQFMQALLCELAPAIESARLRDQEMTTLRQIQLLHAPEGALNDSLGALLENLRQALDAETVWLRLRPSQDERLSGLSVQRGPAPALPPADLESVFERVLRGEAVRSTGPAAGHSTGGALRPPGGAWLALPMRLPEGHVPGMLLVGRSTGLPFHPRQEAILQTVAAQAALLIENERMLRSLEYRAVIQERTRLAREIHDGLAQTLAYLKLQAAQMQSYLAQGDLARLSQVLKDNYQALAEAYLDTRQAIDNLRLTPRNGLEASLEQVAADFEPVLGIHIERNIQALPPSWSAMLSPEIQAQLLRIVQEALNNIRKHARAQRAWINLREWQSELLLEVGDDGQGFDAGDLPEISQHGLRGMRERSELIGADFQIISQVRQGTLVRLALPLDKETQR